MCLSARVQTALLPLSEKELGRFSSFLDTMNTIPVEDTVERLGEGLHSVRSDPGARNCGGRSLAPPGSAR